MDVEHLILKNLVYNDDYARKVLPYIKTDYFPLREQQLTFSLVEEFINKYKSLPTYEALIIQLQEKTNISEDEFIKVSHILSNIKKQKDADKVALDFLVNKTEAFCQERAIHIAIMESVNILSNNSKYEKGEIPALLTDALSVSFDANIGHDYIQDVDARYDFYHQKEKKIPFDIEMLNKITKGGLPAKSLNIFMSGTGVGKSMFMCHHAAHCLSEGFNVLYITMEMAEERIAERIDANLLNVPLVELFGLSKTEYLSKFARIKNKTNGTLIIKEYPTASASALHFRALLHELQLKKKGFRPDIIFIDYLNICASSRIKASAGANSYTYIKSIAEELRGLAVEFNVPIVSATQVSRGGYNSSDVGLEDTSESFGLPATADFMMAMISTEELEQLNQMLFKQLKNRYGDVNKHKKFVVGIDRSKMKLYDVGESAQEGISSANPSYDSYNPQHNKRNKFEGFNV